jgi:hypothetical protein
LIQGQQPPRRVAPVRQDVLELVVAMLLVDRLVELVLVAQV